MPVTGQRFKVNCSLHDIFLDFKGTNSLEEMPFDIESSK